ncbi:hypothetical protein L6R53_27755 [Myxococcota bacterium]|nr:hypothetical protein [Myxococcota bacterium]
MAANSLLVLVLAACGPEGRDSIDFETLCADRWPEDDCADGCADDENEQLFLDVFRPWAAEQVGVSEAALADHITLRQVQAVPQEGGARIDLAFTVDVDWARIMVRWNFDLDADPDADQVMAALTFVDWFPRPPWSATLRPIAELDREILACEEQERVDLPEEGWCSGFVSNNRGEEADAMSFSFMADAPGGDPDDSVWLSLRPSVGATSTCQVVIPTG